MIGITKVKGVITSMAICDICESGFTWDGIVSLSRISWILRKHGWSVGKKDVCENCKRDKERQS
jgi:hypothetical protein